MPAPLIQVCGDPTVDWMTIRQQSEPGFGPFFWDPKQTQSSVGLSVQAGGAALLTEFLKALLPPSRCRINGVTLNPALLTTPNAPITRSWTLWQQVGGTTSGFRIAEWTNHENGAWDYTSQAVSRVPDLLVIEDSGLGFRSKKEDWPEALALSSKRAPEQVLLKLSIYGPGERSSVLNRIRERGLARHTTIVVSVGDVRACGVRVSESLSWERMLEQVRDAVISPLCPFADAKSGEVSFGRVIVTLGVAGAVVVSKRSTALIFDRSGQEGDFQRRFKGEMIGYNTCMAGVLAAAWVRRRKRPNWTQATRDGLAMARLLHIGGYEVTPDDTLRFPAARLAQAYARRNRKGERSGESEGAWDLGVFETDSRGFSNLLTDSRGRWTILKQAVGNDAAGSDVSRAEVMATVHLRARDIVIRGPWVALENVPLETIGAWCSADRKEIEGVRSVKNAIQEYLDCKSTRKPLAIAVFGPPGSGKSFAVKEMATELGIMASQQLTFNLSQFASPEELAAAFHQIQDLHLQGKRPLVFWDEFDTPCEGRPLGWLRYFLAPIQDGQFADRGRVHPTGGGIYVFAGAAKSTFEQFSQIDSDGDRTAKKPDFISRLRAHIDVRGPNAEPDLVQDDLYVVRRAFLLNNFLGRYHPHLKRDGTFRVSDGVLNALLHTVRYRHGARSMESIVAMSSLKGRRMFGQSSLPPEQLLSMHVDASDFVALAEGGRRELLRVGTTGHIGLDLSKMKQLEKGVKKAIERIAKTFPNRWITAFSPLALGADRLIVRKILECPGSRLIAVLPMPPDDYVQDFGPSDSHREDYVGAEARQEFREWLTHKAIETVVRPPSATRDQSYEEVGFYIVEHCDVMIAVYDGEESQGPGGTGDVVKQIRRLRKPLCHVWAGNYKPDPSKRTDVGRKHGMVSFENFGKKT